MQRLLANAIAARRAGDHEGYRVLIDRFMIANEAAISAMKPVSAPTNRAATPALARDGS